MRNSLVSLARNRVQVKLAKAWIGTRYWPGLSGQAHRFDATYDDQQVVDNASQVQFWEYLTKSHSWSKSSSILLWGTPTEDIATCAAVDLLARAAVEDIPFATTTTSRRWLSDEEKGARMVLIRGLGVEDTRPLDSLRHWVSNNDARTLIMTGSSPTRCALDWCTNVARISPDYIFQIAGIVRRAGRRPRA